MIAGINITKGVYAITAILPAEAVHLHTTQGILQISIHLNMKEFLPRFGYNWAIIFNLSHTLLCYCTLLWSPSILLWVIFIFVLGTLQIHPVIPWEILCWATVPPAACQSWCVASNSSYPPAPCLNLKMHFQPDLNQLIAFSLLISHNVCSYTSILSRNTFLISMCLTPHWKKLFQSWGCRKPTGTHLFSWLKHNLLLFNFSLN